MEYTAGLEQKIERVLEKQTALEVQIGELRAGIMPRHEIDSELEKRVPLTMYLADKSAQDTRLQRLEDAPSSTWTRAGIAISSTIGCLGLLVGCVSILVAILVATHVI